MTSASQGDPGAEATLREAARRRGMRSMREDGRRWVDAGITTPDEILRVTRDDE